MDICSIGCRSALGRNSIDVRPRHRQPIGCTQHIDGDETPKFVVGLAEIILGLEERRQDGRDYIICGDWNIAHKQIDLKNWKSNQKNSGFLPEEREWMTKVFDELGYIDVFRQLNQEAEQYTWWSNRGQAWAKNVGWRLDYQVASPGIAEKAIATSIFKDQRFSDHAPLIVEYDNNL